MVHFYSPYLHYIFSFKDLAWVKKFGKLFILLFGQLQCYCYVCEKPAPCEKWTEGDPCLRHCDATVGCPSSNRLNKQKKWLDYMKEKLQQWKVMPQMELLLLQSVDDILIFVFQLNVDKILLYKAMAVNGQMASSICHRSIWVTTRRNTYYRKWIWTHLFFCFWDIMCI